MKYWISFLEKITFLLWERLQDHYLKKSLANRLILKQHLFLLPVYGGMYTYQVSHYRIFFIINDLDKIEVKKEDENQALLLLCSLPYSYKSFREAIFYGGKLTIKVNEVKEHLLSKNKIDNKLTSESHRDDFGQAHF